MTFRPIALIPSSDFVFSTGFLKVSTNVVTIVNPLFSESTLEEYILGKDDLMMNGERYYDHYPVDGALNIESRAQRDEVKSEQHGVATEAVYAGRAESGLFLSESDTK
jgi:hypothetical protein